MVAVSVVSQSHALSALPCFGRTLRRAKHCYGMMKANTTDAEWWLSLHALLNGYLHGWIKSPAKFLSAGLQRIRFVMRMWRWIELQSVGLRY